MLDWQLVDIRDGFELRLEGKVLIRHTKRKPWLSLGAGQASYSMYRGNFDITDKLDRTVCPQDFFITRKNGSATVRMPCGDGEALIWIGTAAGCRRGPEDDGRRDLPGASEVALADEKLCVEFVSGPDWANRWSIVLFAEPGEHAWGCGEQFSHFNLRGKRFPLWTSEQGVGRNKRTLITKMADLHDKAGGDYWWTFFPQPSFSTSRRISIHLETAAWSEFDFRGKRGIRLSTRQKPDRLVFGTASSLKELSAMTARYFGLQPKPPAWVHDGAILGIQGGTETCLAKLDAARKAGVPVSGIWAQDWAGVRHTSFGKRLSWNWELDESLYPSLKNTCDKLAARGVHFMTYVNCYFACDKPIFAELDRLGFLVKAKDGASYRMDAGEFEAGIPDLTNPDARTWFKKLIQKNLLGTGAAGWMADFGEYLPADCTLHDGTPAELAHNLWPSLWARVNFEALEEAGVLEAATFFMRAGYTGSQRWCPLMWAGDQNVDWSKDDGLPSVIPAALSLAMVGHGYHHSDTGGYTTLFGMKRTKELFLRWAELSAFTVMMRTHEGNRPGDNWQFDSDEETLSGFGRMARLRVGLSPYFKALSEECSSRGTPLIRPLFFGDESSRYALRAEDAFMLGDDLFVAPVLKKGARARKVRFIAGDWIHLWSGKTYSGGSVARVAALLGQPPAFYRVGSKWESVFLAAVASSRA